MRTLFTNDLKRRFAHRAGGTRLQAARGPRSACDVRFSPTWTCSSSLPRDLPKPLGAHSLPALRQTLRNAFPTLWRPKHGVTMQGTPIPWGTPQASSGHTGSLPCTKHGVFWGLCSPRMCLELRLLSPWSLDALPSQTLPEDRSLPAWEPSPAGHRQQSRAILSLSQKKAFRRGRAGYEHIAIPHVLPLSGEGLWRLQF